MTLHEGIRGSRFSSSFRATSVRKLGSPVSLRFSRRVKDTWISKVRFLLWLRWLSPDAVAAYWEWYPITGQAHVSGLIGPSVHLTLTLINFRIDPEPPTKKEIRKWQWNQTEWTEGVRVFTERLALSIWNLKDQKKSWFYLFFFSIFKMFRWLK